MNLFISFIILNAVNVIIQTIKSICTIKCGKLIAATTNAIAYGFYTIVVIYMICDLPLWEKVIIIGLCNFVGVFVVKIIEEKLRKDKIWKVEATIPAKEKDNVIKNCGLLNIQHYNYIDANNWIIFNFYCNNQKESIKVKNLLNLYHVRYFVSETKTL